MPAIRTGTRLEQLQSLASRTEHELASARRRDARLEIPRLEQLLSKVREAIKYETSNDPVFRLLYELGVTSRQVRAWALATGRVDRVRRGRLKYDLVRAYADAHQPSAPEEIPDE